MQRLNIDTIGPLPEDTAGNTHILVIIDCFTRWLELYAIKDLTMITAAHALIAHFGRFGCPTQLQSDGGSQFVNNLIAEVSLLVGTKFIQTLAYSKQKNSIVERANKEVMRRLRAIVLDDNTLTTWATRLPFAQRIYNASICV